MFPLGILPHVEPTPYTLNESGQLTNFVDDKSSEIVIIKSELKSPLVSDDESGTSERDETAVYVSLESKILPNNGMAMIQACFDQFVPETRIEAQDFNEVWHRAKVMKVDNDEKEVLVHFEKNAKSKPTPKAKSMVMEWIPMNSRRLRPLQGVKKPVVMYTYKPGDKCLGRWTDSRKFPATVQKVLGNNMYELLFDDGFVKVVKAKHMSKVKKNAPKTSKVTASPKTPKVTVSVEPKRYSDLPIPKFDLSKLNLLPVPKDGEWCCNWVNETPIGAEGYLYDVDGHKRPTVLLEDWRLPTGWTKHAYRRYNRLGQWDVVLEGPTKKRFRTKNDVKVYLEGKGEHYNSEIYDFCIHKKRAKNIGLFVLTDEYKEALKNKKLFRYPTSTPQSLPPPPSDPEFVYIDCLKVELIDNLFHCPEPTCNKQFRKENQLLIHVKHYHEEFAKTLGVFPDMMDLAFQRTVGQAIDEYIPKNRIPKEFFETVYLSDLPSISPSDQIKTEDETHSLAEQTNGISLPSEDMENVAIKQEEVNDIQNIHPTKDFSNIQPIYQIQDLDSHSPVKREPFSQSENATLWNSILI